VSPGITDLAVLEWAISEELLLLTADRDFGDMILRDAHAAPRAGVVLYRLRRLSLAEKADRVSNACAAHATEFKDAFLVIERERVRRRSLT
jgi:predicted nuclease of predicted toxin-antitoxin system